MEFKAGDYKFRLDLENDVRQKVGNTSEPKSEHIITGSRIELARLGLSDKTSVFGIACIVTDTPMVPREAGKPARGDKPKKPRKIKRINKKNK